MKRRRCGWVVGALAAWSLCALADIEVSGSDNFAAVTGVVGAKCTRTAEALVFTDIRYDMQLQLKTPAVYAPDVAGFSFRYRVSGPTSHPRAGGELFYSTFGSAYGDGRKWRIPTLVRDGDWHEITLTPAAAVDVNDWKSCGLMSGFRFDPTNADGGKLEISHIRFLMRGSPAMAAAAKGPVEKFLDEDAWSAVEPETFKLDMVRRAALPAVVTVQPRGGTAVPRIQTAGQKVHLRYDYRGPEPTCADLPVTVAILAEDGTLKWHETLTLPRATSISRMRDDVWALEFDYELPRYVSGGAAFIYCESPALATVGGRWSAARLNIRRLAVDPDWSEPIASRNVDVGGTPCFAVNGKPVYPLWGTVAYGRRTDDPFARHSSAPLNFVTVWTKHLK